MLCRFRVALAGLALASIAGCSHSSSSTPQFQVSFPASLNAEPITGRVFITLFARNDVEPRIAAGLIVAHDHGSRGLGDPDQGLKMRGERCAHVKNSLRGASQLTNC